MAPIDPSLGKKMLFTTLGVRVNRCLEPSQVCTNSAIRAHSVQNATVMRLLQRAGHVKVLAPDHHNADSFALIWRDVGRNLATTFEGFCSDHDAALFAPIDTLPFNETDQEQFFLYAYRAVARELHTLMEAATRTQSLYQQRIEAGIDKGNEPELAGTMAVEQMMTAYSTYTYKTVLDQALLDRNFKILTHEIVRLTPQLPAIAASVFFDLDARRYQEDPPRVALNILPICRDETVVMFSFTDVDARPVREYIREIVASSGEYQSISFPDCFFCTLRISWSPLRSSKRGTKRNAMRSAISSSKRSATAPQSRARTSICFKHQDCPFPFCQSL